MMFVVVVVVVVIDIDDDDVVVVEEFLEDNIEGEKNKIVVVVVDWNCYVKRTTSDCSSPEVHPQFCPRCCRCRP